MAPTPASRPIASGLSRLLMELKLDKSEHKSLFRGRVGVEVGDVMVMVKA